jgi:hypothetical protein
LKIFNNLTPLVPLFFKGEGEIVFEGAKPLQPSPDERVVYGIMFMEV